MSANAARAQMTVWWVLWAAFQTAIFILYHYLSGPATQPRSETGDSPVWIAAFGPLTVSAIVRWLVLPRIRDAQVALQLFVVGIACAEATCFIGIFIFPAHKLELFLWSAIGIFQFVPYFAPRYFTGDNRRPGG